MKCINSAKSGMDVNMQLTINGLSHFHLTRFFPRHFPDIFSYPLAFDDPVRGFPVGIAPPRLVWKN